MPNIFFKEKKGTVDILIILILLLANKYKTYQEWHICTHTIYVTQTKTSKIHFARLKMKMHDTN